MPFTNSFMQPVVEQAPYYEVETNFGTWIVPADVVGFPFAPTDGETYTDEHPQWEDICAAVEDYVEGNDTQHVTPKSGWIARMSASGYMDATDWSAFDTEQEAIDYLEETYGDDA